MKHKQKKRQEYQDLIRQIKELDSKAQTIIIRSLSKDDKLKYITNGTLNNTIKNMDPNTWNERVYNHFNSHDSAPFYNMQDNTGSSSRLSGNMNGSQINDQCIAITDGFGANWWDDTEVSLLYYHYKGDIYHYFLYNNYGLFSSRNIFLYKE